MPGTLAQPLARPVPGQQRLTEATQDPGLQHCLTPVPGHTPNKDPEQGRQGAGGKQPPHRVGGPTWEGAIRVEGRAGC